MYSENTSSETLKNQLDINTSQLRDLFKLSRTFKLNITIYLIGIFICLVPLTLIIWNISAAIMYREFNNDFISYLGSILVFLILALMKLFQLAHEHWLKLDETNFIIHQQELAISNAQKYLSWN